MEQASIRSAHLGSKRHPNGTHVGSGDSPAIAGRGAFVSVALTSVDAAMLTNACVYGCRDLRKIAAVLPTSTMRPAYITAIRSANPANSDGSWLMTRIAVPCCCLIRYRRATMSVCRDASSLLVGWSSISRAGKNEMAGAARRVWGG